MSNLHDLSEWTPITCAESDDLRSGSSPVSSLTDLYGTYGTPIVYTEWADTSGQPILRDYRWPGTERHCGHYTPTPKEQA